MKSEAEVNILLVDQTLDMLRSFLADAKEAEKGAIQEKINHALDHRLKLMQIRDKPENL